MPHLTLHYTTNLDGFDPGEALREINYRLADSGHFDEEAIKSRALPLPHYRVGVVDEGRAFIHAQLKVLPGRDASTRHALAQTVLAALHDTLSPHALSTQICVEVDELDADTYSKIVLDANTA